MARKDPYSPPRYWRGGPVKSIEGYAPVDHEPPAKAQARLAWALLEWWDAEGLRSDYEHSFMESEVLRLFGPSPERLPRDA